MTEKTWLTLILVVGAAVMIAARRYKNTEPNAGLGIAGWTIVILLHLWC